MFVYILLQKYFTFSFELAKVSAISKSAFIENPIPLRSDNNKFLIFYMGCHVILATLQVLKKVTMDRSVADAGPD